MNIDDLDDETRKKGLRRLYAFVASSPDDKEIEMQKRARSRSVYEEICAKTKVEPDYATHVVLPMMRFLDSFPQRHDTLMRLAYENDDMLMQTGMAGAEDQVMYEVANYVLFDQATVEEIQKAAAMEGLDAEKFLKDWEPPTFEDLNPSSGPS